MKRQFSLKKLIQILIICSMGIGLTIAFKPNYIKLHELQTHYSHLKQKLFLEEKRSQQLKRELNGLTNNPDWIEKVAREKLGWCSLKETIYRFQTSDSNR